MEELYHCSMQQARSRSLFVLFKKEAADTGDPVAGKETDGARQGAGWVQQLMHPGVRLPRFKPLLPTAV